MRFAFGLVGLLIVLWLVSRLAGGRLGALAPVPPDGGGAASASVAEQTAAKVARAIAQGAAARADDAASRRRIADRGRRARSVDDHAATPVGRVWATLTEPESWPRWWPYVRSVQTQRRGDASGIGSVRRIHWGTRLPYDIVIEVEARESFRHVECDAQSGAAGRPR